MTRSLLTAVTLVALGCGAARSATAQQGAEHSHSDQKPHGSMSAASQHDHGAGVAVTYAELQRMTEQLTAARQATARYQDVRVAEAEGYRAVGPNVPGMGVHYVRTERREGFSVTEPPILLYERDRTSDALRLTGVSYLFVAPVGEDGQPKGSPFPKALARWHKHNNVCVLPDNNATVDLNEAQCTAKGGRFTSETSWMVHAWIWKDSPLGVFSPTNPLVK